MSTAPNGTAKWQLWASLAGTAIVVLGSIIGLYMKASDAYTKAQELDRRMDAVEQLARTNSADLKVMNSDMREIDTQLRASIDDRNLTHAWDLRIESMLWEKAFDGRSHFPTDNAVYPNIAEGKSQ